MNRELLQQCLEALDSVPDFVFFVGAEKIGIAIKAIKAELAKPEPAKRTPVVEGQLFRRVLKSKSSFPQYEPDVYIKIPVQRVPLGDEEIMDKSREMFLSPRWPSTAIDLARSIENAVYEKLGIG